MITYLDERWFQQCRDIGMVPYLHLLNIEPSHKKMEQEIFLSGTHASPHFIYSHDETVDIAKKREQFLSLKKSIHDEESNTWIRDAYVRLIDEQLALCDLVEATKVGDDTRFCAISAELFGIPTREDMTIVRGNVDRLLATALQFPNLADDAHYITQVLSACSSATDISDDLTMTFTPEQQPVHDAVAIQKTFQQALSEHGVHEWHVEIETTGAVSFIRVDQNTRTIMIPASRRLSDEQLRGRVAHEVGVHVMRREHAGRLPLRILSLGMDGYILTEEGISKYEEKKYYPATLISSMELYLGIALALGIDGVSRTFRDMYNFFVAYYRIKQRCMELDHDDDTIQDMAWTRTERLYRGTSGSTVGACFTKDMVYWDGYIKMLHVLDTFPKEHQRFFVGKYNPADAFHRDFLDAFGIV